MYDSDKCEEIFAGMLALILVGILLALLLLPFYLGHICYHFNQSDCSVWVNGEMVYNGKCHFVDIEPVGEYGNSKRATIYKDVKCWHVVQKYISEDIEVREAVNNGL